MRTYQVRFIAIGLLTFGGSAFAQITPGPNPVTGTLTTTQTLSSGTGTVDSTGQIRIASGSSAALLMSGTSTLVNNGSILTLGSGRAIDSNSGIANLTVTNNGLISSFSSDAFRVNTNSAVSLFNSGTIRVTAGGQAIDWAAITSASNTLTNLSTGVITAVGEDAVRPGVNGVVLNSGTISATPTLTGGAASGSDGIDLRTLSGIHVTNHGSITGRHGIATDGANAGPSTFFLENDGTLSGLNGSGLNIDGVSASVQASVLNSGIIRGGVMAGTTDADGDGVDVDGVLTLWNSGQILGLGARGGANNAEGIAAGGGSITNATGGRIIGSTLLADAPNGDFTRAGNGILIDDSNGGNAVAATIVSNDGLIQGTSGFGIRIIGTFADSITNNGGAVIKGTGTGATIQTGGGNDTLINRGSILSEAGKAIDLEAGDDSLRIEGGAASVVGDVSGGTGANSITIDAGDSNHFVYAGVLSNFAAVEVLSGQAILSGANQYDGLTIIRAGSLTLSGNNRLAATSGLELNDGATLALENTLGANAQTFASLALSGAATIDLGGSSLTFGSLGSVGAGSSLAVANWTDASPLYAFRFVGDTTANAAFLALIGGTTIDGYAAAFSFDGAFTNVNVSAVPLPGALALFVSGLGFLGRRHAKKP